MAELLFEGFGVPAMLVLPRSLLAAYSYGRTTGVVVGSGAGTSDAAGVREGYALPHATFRLDVAGDALTLYLGQLLESRGVHLDTYPLCHLKETCCCVLPCAGRPQPVTPPAPRGCSKRMSGSSAPRCWWPPRPWGCRGQGCWSRHPIACTAVGAPPAAPHPACCWQGAPRCCMASPSACQQSWGSLPRPPHTAMQLPGWEGHWPLPSMASREHGCHGTSMQRAALPSCTPTAADPNKGPRVATGGCTPLFSPSPPLPAPRKDGWGLFGPVARPTHAITADCLTVAMAMASTQGCGAAWRLSHGHAARPPAAPRCTPLHPTAPQQQPPGMGLPG
ncbi:uncharacterized protein LOC130598422 [Pezoporus wallicus]|uniref:uncharacterized protein LOC130598422 n=1 Tax=Pezoporus wallicus TaxID=35540 RepID=UPI00254EAC0F|nr:uncharacterized protein LOC130598422 [Pezoporus wallicus]